ncbi:B-box zinc finger [Seminavis robusta]|uniref:B-box zinc finger n=1 Tax=Seminavis robusta TaxID=568900 RepID=A0A9N8HH79_9STRA|nr:B-box zinc finger [Seminavis robusta]|eukprot:Sro435_g142260.1 B-box zinc finger (815) ;mRNA; f:12500-14944
MGKKPRRKKKGNRVQRAQVPSNDENAERSAKSGAVDTSNKDTGMSSGMSATAEQFPTVSQSFKLQFMEHNVTNEALDKILARGVLDEELNSREKLWDYFLKLVINFPTALLTEYILRGLVLGPPHIDRRVNLAPGNKQSEFSFPLLSWACQWKLAKENFHWLAQDEMVDMIIKAGANVNSLMENKTNALFLAVKYGSLQTVDLLLEAGCNIHQVDQFDRTCLYNATEHPSPPILRRLLEQLPATEMCDLRHHDGSLCRLTMVDRIMSHFVTADEEISWKILGPPTASDLSESLIVLRQSGASFSVKGSAFALEVLGNVRDPEFAFGTEKPKEQEVFREVATCLVGAWLPDGCRPNPLRGGEVKDPFLADGKTKLKPDEGHGVNDFDAVEAPKTCQLCLKVAKKPATLYCGDTFCRKCIIEHSRKEEGNSSPSCPTCRRFLCKELLGGKTEKVPYFDTMRRIAGASTDLSQRGPRYFTDDQLKAEAQFQGITYTGINDLRLKLQADFLSRPERSPMKASGPSGVTVTEEVLSVDLAAAFPFGNSQAIRWAPEKGPVYIDVSVRGIPLLARISNWSLYTMLSHSVVDQLGLRRIESLTSTKFVDIQTKSKCRDLTFTCIEAFSINVGGIDVTLSNAVEVYPDPMPVKHTKMFGIQLGQDFLLSARWAPIDVAVGGRGAIKRIDIDKAWSVDTSIKNQSKTSALPDTPKEMLRFYSCDGRIAHIPLLHFKPFERGYICGTSLKETVRFEGCRWCRRVFPEGMQGCDLCAAKGRDAFFCTRQCLLDAWVIHKKLVHGKDREERHQHDEIDLGSMEEVD